MNITSRIKRMIGTRLGVMSLVFMLVASVMLNILLAYRIRQFGEIQKAQKTEIRMIKIGASVPPIVAKRLYGEIEIINYQKSDRPTVLYVFTPQCGWCTRNLDNLKTLIHEKSKEYRFIVISLSDDDLEKYASEHKFIIPIYTGISGEMREAYKLGSTPQMIVISTKGEVMQNWIGAYVGNQKAQVESFFGVTLPGIQSNN